MSKAVIITRPILNFQFIHTTEAFTYFDICDFPHKIENEAPEARAPICIGAGDGQVCDDDDDDDDMEGRYI